MEGTSLQAIQASAGKGSTKNIPKLLAIADSLGTSLFGQFKHWVISMNPSDRAGNGVLIGDDPKAIAYSNLD